jgi:hypothetical protein
MLKRSSAALAGLAVAVACLTSGAADDQPDSTQALLGRIKKVGREGKNNADAAKAWKQLVAKGPVALLPILDAMEDDDPTSANWLRPAFEAVAEKALDAGKLSKGDLEKFVLDTKKGGGARRLAYEWLVKLDKGAPDRLLPRMLLDPSHELRRDAIDWAIEQAEAQKDEKIAKEVYRKALKGACDQDQIETIVKALDKLGEKVDVVAHLGFVTNWQIVGPFDNRKGVGFAAVYPPEKGVDLSDDYDGREGKKVQWKAHLTDRPYGLVDLNKVVGELKGVVAYAYAVVDSPEERPVEIRAGCITSLKVFLNGKEVFAHDEYHHGSFMDQYVARVTLKKGTNRLLLKVCQNEQKEQYAKVWNFQLRLCDRVGSAVPFTQKAAKKEDR